MVKKIVNKCPKIFLLVVKLAQWCCRSLFFKIFGIVWIPISTTTWLINDAISKPAYEELTCVAAVIVLLRKQILSFLNHCSRVVLHESLFVVLYIEVTIVTVRNDIDIIKKSKKRLKIYIILVYIWNKYGWYMEAFFFFFKISIFLHDISFPPQLLVVPQWTMNSKSCTNNSTNY